MAPFATLHTFTHIAHAKGCKVLAVAHVANLDVQVAPDYEPGVTNSTSSFLSKFPMGQVPALETGTGFCISENAAICHFLARSSDKRTQLLGDGAEQEALIQMWSALSETEIFPNAYAIIVPMMGREPYVEWSVKKKEEVLDKAIDRVEIHLKAHKWLGGDTGLNLGDISMAAAVFWPMMFFWDAEKRARWPNVVNWYTRFFEQDEGLRTAFDGGPKFCATRMPPFPKDGQKIM